MRFWPKSELNKVQKTAPVEQPASAPELLLTPEMEFKGTFEYISTPEEFLDAIDFKALNDIFDELILKSGGTENVNNSGHKVERDKIEVEPFMTRDGTKPYFGRATIDTGEIELIWIVLNQKDIEGKMHVLKTLVHEAVHVRGGYKCTKGLAVLESDENLKIERVKHENIGLKQTSSGFSAEVVDSGLGAISSSALVLGVSLNEAVTENIAHEILSEYLIRTGDSGYLLEKKVLGFLGEGSYAVDRMILSIVIGALANELDISMEEIWKGFVKAYMQGDTDILDLMSEVESRLVNTPEISKVAMELAKGEALNDVDYVFSDFSNEMDNQSRDALRKVLKPFDKEHLQNVLGLR